MYKRQGILNVTAKDRATGRSQQVAITASTNLNEAEIQRLVREAETHAAEDQRRRELIEARNAADQVIYQTEKSLAELNGSAAGGRGEVDAQIAQLREALNTEDTARIRQLTEAVQRAAMTLGEAAYRQQSAEQTGATEQTGRDEDVVEGEYEAA